MKYNIKKIIPYLIIIFGIYFGIILKTDTTLKTDITIKREQLTKKEEFLFNSTGIYHNYVYKIEGISKQKNYELLCWGEEYKDGKLVNKVDISKYYVNSNNNIDSSLYVVLNFENAPDNTLALCIGTLSDVPNSMVVKKKKDVYFSEGVGSSLDGINLNVNQDIALLSFSKAYDGGSDSSVDLDNLSSIEKGIKDNDMVRLLKVKLIED